mmetsp:Transcript_82119/g.219789  ORF Transcript_82119/g.219789 Transcript_82119/m.219789 type:complete len:224 (-) Transcript_82119:15-686(-)
MRSHAIPPPQADLPSRMTSDRSSRALACLRGKFDLPFFLRRQACRKPRPIAFLPALPPGRLAPSRHVLQRRLPLHLRPADLQHLLAAGKPRQLGVLQPGGRFVVGCRGGTVQEDVPPVAPGADVRGDVKDVEGHAEGQEGGSDLLVAEADGDVLQHHRGDLGGFNAINLLGPGLGDLLRHPAHQLTYDRPLGLGSAPAGLRSAGEVQEGVLQESHGFEGELQL